MKTTKRFEDAVTKLYTAFHNGELNAMDCRQCAVGNMCDNSSNWGFYGSEELRTPTMRKTGYSAYQLENIESIFMHGNMSNEIGIIWDLSVSQTKEEQFTGLCAVIEYLCELDNIPNVLDFKGLFETEDNKPVNQLQFV